MGEARSTVNELVNFKFTACESDCEISGSLREQTDTQFSREMKALSHLWLFIHCQVVGGVGRKKYLCKHRLKITENFQFTVFQTRHTRTAPLMDFQVSVQQGGGRGLKAQTLLASLKLIDVCYSSV